MKLLSVDIKNFLFAGVCLMVGSLFMLMVGVEILWGKVEEKYQQLTRKTKDQLEDATI